MSHDVDAGERSLGRTVRAVLRRFRGRCIDDALLAEMAEALNEELTSFRSQHRIELALEGSAIRVELRPEQTVAVVPTERAATVGFEAVADALAA